MPLTYEKGATIFSSFGDGDKDWQNTNNLLINGSETICPTKDNKGDVARSLMLKGFTHGTLAKYSKIVGIEVIVKRRQSDNNSTRDDVVRLIVNDVITGTNKASSVTWPLVGTVVAYGGSTDTWGLSEMELSNILNNHSVASNFGLVFRPTTDTSSSTKSRRSNLYIDYIYIKLYAEVRECYTYRNGEWVSNIPEIKTNNGYTVPVCYVYKGGKWQEVFLI